MQTSFPSLRTGAGKVEVMTNAQAYERQNVAVRAECLQTRYLRVERLNTAAGWLGPRAAQHIVIRLYVSCRNCPLIRVKFAPSVDD